MYKSRIDSSSTFFFFNNAHIEGIRGRNTKVQKNRWMEKHQVSYVSYFIIIITIIIMFFSWREGVGDREYIYWVSGAKNKADEESPE